MRPALLANQHLGRLVTVTCVRKRYDLGYLETYRELERRYENFRYLPCTTREPENLDPTLPNYKPKRYLQEYVDCGEFESDAELTLDPATCRIFLCGNPAMIGAPARGAPSKPSPDGMIHVLQRRGFTIGDTSRPGNIHFEKYW